jgi:cold shock CspA family protein
MEAVMRGKVVRVVSDKGFGFIRAEDGLDYFFHKSGISDGRVWEQIVVGHQCVFEPVEGPKGLRAAEVKVQ